MSHDRDTEVQRLIAEALAPLHKRIAELETRVVELEGENIRLRAQNVALQAEIARLKKNGSSGNRIRVAVKIGGHGFNL